MAGEVSIRAGLDIKKDNLQFNSRPNNYKLDMTGKKGPSPGAVNVTPEGTVIDFSELDVPGVVQMQNLDDSNIVHVGIWDPETLKFYALFQLRPGAVQVGEFSSLLQEEFGTGTGTTGGNTNRLMLRSSNTDCPVTVNAFEA